MAQWRSMTYETIPKDGTLLVNFQLQFNTLFNIILSGILDKITNDDIACPCIKKKSYSETSFSIINDCPTLSGYSYTCIGI